MKKRPPITRSLPIWLVFMAVLAIACSNPATLVVHLAHPPQDDPYAQVAILRMLLQRQDDQQVLIDQTYSATDARFELDTVDLDGPVRLSVLGYPDASMENLLARGASEWLDVPAGQEMDVTICFCSLAVIDAEGCACPED